MNGPAARRIVLCADDYGISPGVNRAIRELIAQRRLNATSVMMVGPAIGRDEAAALLEAAQAGAQLGLHVTLTAPFHPLTVGFRPLSGGNFLPLAAMLKAAMLRWIDRRMIQTEVAAQIAAFTERFGRPPDYLDGHQHVHLFPRVRDGVLSAMQAQAPQAWVRQCGRTRARPRIGGAKALLLDLLSVEFRRAAARAGLRSNPSFAGAYAFGGDFGDAMRGFLDTIGDGGLIMCHPGYVDDTLAALDPVTQQREVELAYLAGERFAADLAARAITLA
jgi:predicted glycoside hydrolase/deacetylase ChbG (UPF0249 family)